MTRELTTLFTGRRRFDLDSVASTNAYLGELLRREALPEGALVSTTVQLEGRGQHGTRWLSAPGKNLLASFYFRPDFLPLSEVFRLNEIFSLAVSDTVASFITDEVQIKWPNDIYVKGEKVAGLLIENTIQGSRIGASILGVGFNVNETMFPAELPNPVSLAILTRHQHEIESVVIELCNRLERRYLQLKSGKTEGLRQEFIARQYRRGVWALFSDSNGTFRARFKDITPEGRLSLEHEDGSVLQYDLKSIRYVLDC